MFGLGLEAWHIWLIVAIILFIGEVLSLGFFLMFFGLGALLAAGAALLGYGLIWQLIIFVLVSAVVGVLSRPIFLRMTTKEAPTNVDALVGRRAVVTEEIDPKSGAGRVRVDGDDWRAEVESDAAIAEGEHVEIIAVESATLVVRPAAPQKEAH